MDAARVRTPPSLGPVCVRDEQGRDETLPPTVEMASCRGNPVGLLPEQKPSDPVVCGTSCNVAAHRGGRVQAADNELGTLKRDKDTFFPIYCETKRSQVRQEQLRMFP
ncbi:hypothetical protein WMY93_009937 [Mugilogobius chulae]|uniref:Uncharacterized protein n=1 Tax=Mugilogobius chulae TaxID=88201 RepID=A0AAW0P647_9GOBI